MMSNHLHVHLRPVVRSILSFKPAQWFPTARVFAAVRDEAQWHEASLEEVAEALQWNADQGFAERMLDRDRSTPKTIYHRWRISEAGLELANSEM